MWYETVLSLEEVYQLEKSTRQLVVCALLVALGVVLNILSAPVMNFGTYSMKVGLTALPIILAGILYGPMYGGIVGGITDILQLWVIPKGAYIPWFTLVSALIGLIPGLFFMKKQELRMERILLAIATGQIIASVLLNTTLLVQLYGLPREAIYLRIINQAIMIPVYTILINAIIKQLAKSNILEKIQ